MADTLVIAQEAGAAPAVSGTSQAPPAAETPPALEPSSQVPGLTPASPDPAAGPAEAGARVEPAAGAQSAAPVADAAAGAPAGSQPVAVTDAPAAAGSDVPGTLETIVPDAPPLSAFGYDLQPAVDLVDKGGPVVVILLALSVIATTVILVKVAQLLWLGTGATRRTEKALQLWLSGQHEAGYRHASTSRQPAARVLAHGMRGAMAGVDERVVREDVERIATNEISGLRSYLRVLEITVQTAPLLGLFGTVLGMISAFQALQNAGADADPTVLAGGIWVALMTTAVGLAIAIPVAYVHAWLEGRIERETLQIETALTSLFTARATERSSSTKPALHAVPAERGRAHAAE